MDIAWFTFFLAAVVLPPATVFVVVFDYARHSVLRDVISRAKLLVLAVIGSLGAHFVWIVGAELCPLFPPVDFEFVYRLATARELDQQAFTHSVMDHWYFIAAYYMSQILVAVFVGIWAGAEVAKKAELEDELDGYVVDGVKGMWCLIDVFVEGNVLYRGLFHSRGKKVNGERTINLSLVSKIPGQGNVDSSEKSKPVVKFAPIRSRASFEELVQITGNYVHRWDMEKDEQEKAVQDVFKSGESFARFLREISDISPQLIIPWRRVRNINVRPFYIEGPDPSPPVPDVVDEHNQ